MVRMYLSVRPVPIENLEPPEREESGVVCSCCSNDLEPGMEYGELDSVVICENCMTNMSSGVIFDLLGGDWKRVEDED